MPHRKNIFFLLLLFTATAFSHPSAAAAPKENLPLGLPPPPAPSNNPPTPEKIALGKALFSDTRLSADGKISCAHCHRPEHAFTDGRAVAKGLRDQSGTRNTPTLLNVAYLTSFFWDGRRERLEDQARDPFVNPLEHGLADHATVLKIVRTDKKYVSALQKVFGVDAAAIEMEHIAQALASFLRSLLAADSPFDRYYYAHDQQALSAAAVHGFEIFRGKARCNTCHTLGDEGAIFTDNLFHSLGIGMPPVASKLGALAKQAAGISGQELDKLIASKPEIAALGRFVVTRKPADIGRFRTPSLRNVNLTAPYMHDGSMATLEEAVELEVYYRGIEAGRPLILTAEEKADLVSFLKSLTSVEVPVVD